MTSWTQDEVRAFALSLPEAHEHSHMGRPDLRVRNRIFVTLPPDGRTVNIKTTPLGLDMLVRADPDSYRDVWGGRWVGVDLGQVDPTDVRELLVEGYCLAAPRRLASLVPRPSGPPTHPPRGDLTMPEATLETASARQDIDAANRRFEAAIRAGDPDRAAEEVYTRGARVLPPGAPLVQGRESIRSFWQAAVQQMGIRAVKLETVELALHDSHAHEIGRATLTLNQGQEVVAKYVVIWAQEDGQWRWDVDIWNTDA